LNRNAGNVAGTGSGIVTAFDSRYKSQAQQGIVSQQFLLAFRSRVPQQLTLLPCFACLSVTNRLPARQNTLLSIIAVAWYAFARGRPDKFIFRHSGMRRNPVTQ
jgi:hypothetical protein